MSWNTIDSDAGVFSELVERLGVKNVQFDELYSIDSESLTALAPVHAVIFLFKYVPSPPSGDYDRDYLEKGIFFARQTIPNACATQAVLHALLNKTDVIDIGPELSGLRDFVSSFDPDTCGDALSNSETLRQVHNSFSAPVLVEEDGPSDSGADAFHFVAYLHMHDHMYELDGLRPFPIRHEQVNPEDFYTQLPNVLARRISSFEGEIRFSLLAVTNDKLVQYAEQGDDMAMQQELSKRDTWKRENELRRHDFAPLVVELLRNITKDMSDDEFETLLKGKPRK
ncbi:putative ubiquitin carboxyl-terminal hydrolase [Clavispora lusitaniae]|uniref:Ubiquitin carboxyl-terminal hydrolase n=1 Tax=Clavispora lusitaniae TaxID=36911 RepID=A0ACD0WHG3_CLALS|nr:putative ubiquitin carboxyl-terminal hydrolase [Clavispora lusitaniae]QFZ32407.1 putative ubiquitin carboxyl-terminal hydrolase [Clavispora lusitaniae]QFZ38076.1 putative ubiquitin carboxyl-terminal hydrolase [Clavispora lusitaniae]QFZ43759.1 putative ubiquitin carboxyl-terminal hydrolase [Clavispora lusitaniae]QFZ49436.1 putative ubiquitin carboxyl-terminal hydrolase [Clavispora lusitaniae]